MYLYISVVGIYLECKKIQYLNDYRQCYDIIFQSHYLGFMMYMRLWVRFYRVMYV